MREASPGVIFILLEAYVVAEEKTDRIGSSLLTFGIINSTSKRWASHASAAYPNSAKEPDEAGCYLLYRGLQENLPPASPGAILTVLDSYTDAAEKVWRGKSCLHIGMENGACKKVIRALLRENSDATMAKDHMGSYPLHFDLHTGAQS